MMSELDQHSSAPVNTRRDRPPWLQALVAVPATVLPLLPSFSCPVCIAAYAGVLSSLGLGFMLNDRVQRPFIVFFLTVMLGSVVLATRQHRRLGPLYVVLPGALAVVAARIVWNVPWVVYAGVALLIAGTVWNLILKRARRPLVQLGPAQARSTNT